MLANAPDYLNLEYNLVLTRVDFGRLVAGTPAAALWSSGAVSRVGYFLNNVSNLLRIVLLIRFGGIYFDSDVISLKPLPEADQVSCHLIANRSQIHATLITFFAQPQNFIVATERDKVNNAVMRFRRGHPFLRFMLRELVSNFKSSKWGNQGGPKFIGVSLTIFIKW